jgi:hypothetical protein
MFNKLLIRAWMDNKIQQVKIWIMGWDINRYCLFRWHQAVGVQIMLIIKIFTNINSSNSKRSMFNQIVIPQQSNPPIKSKMNKYTNINKTYISKQPLLDRLRKILKIHNKQINLIINLRWAGILIFQKLKNKMNKYSSNQLSNRIAMHLYKMLIIWIITNLNFR